MVARAPFFCAARDLRPNLVLDKTEATRPLAAIALVFDFGGCDKADWVRPMGTRLRSMCFYIAQAQVHSPIGACLRRL